MDTFWSDKTDVLLQVKHPPYITTLTDNLSCLVPHQCFNKGKIQFSTIMSCTKKICSCNKLLCFKLYFSVLFELYSHLQTDNLNELLDIDLSWQDDYWNGNSEGAAAHNSSPVSVSLNQSKQELDDSIQHLSMDLSSRGDCALESSQNSFSLSDNTGTAGLCGLLVLQWVLKIKKFTGFWILWYSKQNIFQKLDVSSAGEMYGSNLFSWISNST